MKEKIYEHPAGLALGIASGIVYAICALLVALWPVPTIRLFSSWFHSIDLTKIIAGKGITFGSFLLGLIEIVIAAYLFGVLSAWLYNKCFAHCRRKGWL